ncbi:MAG: uroporphyrinogen-III synthase [Novosphingobium sp.]|jgi:uroporphyrinogen-III synthase|nr:uroporphyrinogen-III synthase [Novosphingobium sp.]
MKPLVVIRPQPGNAATVAAARALGLDVRGFALFAVRPVDWSPPPPDSFDAILLGSANAVRHAGPALAAYRGKPAYAVGAATGEAARAAGLDVLAAGAGGIAAVLPALRSGHCRLLRLAGRERVALTPPPGASIRERVVYASEPLPLPPPLAELLERPAVVMLHSAEAARHFSRLCDGHGIRRGRIALAALGPRVAHAAGEGWAALAAAATPDETALLALARQMCQNRGG